MPTVAAIVLALAVLVWAYGVYCYVQMVRHRRQGVSALSITWPAASLTEPGLEFRRRALVCYGVFTGLAILLIILAGMNES